MAAQIPHLRVEEIIEKAESGATEPYFCRLSDDQVYLAKGKAALPRGLVAEVVCALLGQAYGLPVPPIALAYLEPALVALNREAQLSLAGGILFGSKRCDNLHQVSREMLQNSDRILLRKLFLFDYWILNEDRTGTVFGGNSNLFRNVETGELVVLDHNLAFSRSFDIEAFSSFHIARDFWFSGERLLLDRDVLVSEMDAAARVLDDVDEVLPEEWLEGAPAIMDEFREMLSRFDQDAFWEALL